MRPLWAQRGSLDVVDESHCPFGQEVVGTNAMHEAYKGGTATL